MMSFCLPPPLCFECCSDINVDYSYSSTVCQAQYVEINGNTFTLGSNPITQICVIKDYSQGFPPPVVVIPINVKKSPLYHLRRPSAKMNIITARAIHKIPATKAILFIVIRVILYLQYMLCLITTPDQTRIPEAPGHSDTL